jgi:hypothetical protein
MKLIIALCGIPSPSTDDLYGRYFTAGFKLTY